MASPSARSDGRSLCIGVVWYCGTIVTKVSQWHLPSGGAGRECDGPPLRRTCGQLFEGCRPAAPGVAGRRCNCADGQLGPLEATAAGTSRRADRRHPVFVCPRFGLDVRIAAEKKRLEAIMTRGPHRSGEAGRLGHGRDRGPPVPPGLVSAAGLPRARRRADHRHRRRERVPGMRASPDQHGHAKQADRPHGGRNTPGQVAERRAAGDRPRAWGGGHSPGLTQSFFRGHSARLASSWRCGRPR